MLLTSESRTSTVIIQFADMKAQIMRYDRPGMVKNQALFNEGGKMECIRKSIRMCELACMGMFNVIDLRYGA